MMPLDLADRPQQTCFPIHSQRGQHILGSAVKQSSLAAVKRISRHLRRVPLVQSALNERRDEIGHHHASLSALQLPLKAWWQSAVRVLIIRQAQFVEVDWKESP